MCVFVHSICVMEDFAGFRMGIEPLAFIVKQGVLILPMSTSIDNLAQYSVHGAHLEDNMNAADILPLKE